jgi:hypothetical protein
MLTVNDVWVYESKAVPLMCKAFQEAMLINDEQEARVATVLVGASTRTGKKRKV